MTYTAHGHWIGSGEPTEPRPQLVAKCGGPGICGKCNQEACNAGFGGEAAGQTGDQVACPSCGHAFAPLGVRVTESTSAPERPTEAMIDGELSYDDKRDLVRQALTERICSQRGTSYAWVYISDLTDAAVVYASLNDDLYQCEYSLDASNVVTLGEPFRVVRTYTADPAAAPSAVEPVIVMDELVETDRVSARADARVIEAKGETADGGRIFRARIIEAGDSKNGRRYPQAVLEAAASLYEGAKAYDRHRDLAELKSGTIVGLVGAYRSVEAEADGLYADLHLLPGATHAAEALDAALAGQSDGLDPLIGLSHDVYATFKAITENGVQMQEATAITKVNSVDLVSDPAAGGKASRVLANIDPTGAEPETVKEDTVPTREEILAAFKDATPEELAAVGLAKATETAKPEPVKEPEPVKAAETGEPKAGFLGKLLIKAKVEDAGLPVQFVESVTNALPDRITEGDVDAAIASTKAIMAPFERQILAPTVTVTQEAVDKKKAALDAFFAGKFSEGYHSFRQAFTDFTGRAPRAFDEDFNRVVLRESAIGFDSGDRSTESLNASSWNLVLGDSITRRMVAEYNQPNLQTWRQVVSSIVPVNDFRTQRIDRVGGYGTLPAVNQGAPYQPLTSPTNEEVTYAVTKRGGTEDITLEMIANDDVRAISKIPTKLGMAAAQTLYRFVWDLLNPASNPTIYDGAGLWTGHNNAATAALSSTAVSAGRLAMRSQSAYGDTSDILSLVPRFLVVVNDLEELAWQICTSTVAMPSGAPVGAASDIPNLHQGMTPIVVDYWTSTIGWELIADPGMCPTIEVGFYQGRELPELFTQSDPSVGSMFNSDALTYKIRHSYSGAILDFRPFYRGNA